VTRWYLITMRDRLLTVAEKRAFRTMPCGKCRAKPPHADGNWTQKHRIKPGSKGGKYTVRNTVARCPKCHSKEPGHSPGIITQPQAKRRELGLKSGGWRPIHKLHPNLARETLRRTNRRYPNLSRDAGRKGGRAFLKSMTPKQRREWHASGGRRTHELHPNQSRNNMLGALRRYPKLFSDLVRKNNHVRWHLKRGLTNPKCKYCKKGGS